MTRALALVTIVLVLPLSVGAGPSVALGGAVKGPAPDGKLVFTRFVSLGKPVQMFTVNSDGSGLHRLAVGDAFHPAWSPNGRQIAYHNGGSIYVVNADGSGKRALPFPSGPAEYRDPRWSPDGRRIVFDSYELGRGQALEVENVDGSHHRTVPLRIDASGPDWSPDGQRLAFWSYRRGMFIASLDGSGLKRITTKGTYGTDIRWSPDGRRLLFIGDAGGGQAGIFTVSAHGGAPIRLQVFATFSPSSVSWSPDGKEIAYTAGKDCCAIHIFDLARQTVRALKLQPCTKPASCEDLDWR